MMPPILPALLLLGMLILVFQWVREDVVKMKTGQPGLLDLARTALTSIEIGFIFFGLAVLIPLIWTIMK
jgi:hypothetical protein